MTNNPDLTVDLYPTSVRFTFRGTVLQDVERSRRRGEVIWHPADLGGYPGISEHYRRAVEERMAEYYSVVCHRTIRRGGEEECGEPVVLYEFNDGTEARWMHRTNSSRSVGHHPLIEGEEDVDKS